jgi:hypothetical protein
MPHALHHTAAALLGMAAVATCSRPATAPAAGAPSVSAALRTLEVTAVPSAPVLSRGDTITVRVRVVNRSTAPIVVVGSGSCGVGLEVRDAAGALVEPSRSRACTLDCRPFRFAPGEAVERTERFTARNWSNAEQRFVTLTPGTYQLVGRVDGSLGECSGGAVQAASAPAEVRLL